MADDAKRLYRLCVPLYQKLKLQRVRGPKVRTANEDYASDINFYDKQMQVGSPVVQTKISSSRKISLNTVQPSPGRVAIRSISKGLMTSQPDSLLTSSAKASRTRPKPASRETPLYRSEPCNHGNMICKDCACSIKACAPQRSTSVVRRPEYSPMQTSNEATVYSSRASYFMRLKPDKRELECMTIVKNLDRLNVKCNGDDLARTASMQLSLNEVTNFLYQVNPPKSSEANGKSVVIATKVGENFCPNKIGIPKTLYKAVFRKGPARIRSVSELHSHSKAHKVDRETCAAKQGHMKGPSSPKTQASDMRKSPEDMSRRIELAKLANEVYMDHKSRHPSILRSKQPKERFEIWRDSSDDEEDDPKLVRFSPIDL